MPLQPSAGALNLIREFEGCAQKIMSGPQAGDCQAYPDPGSHGPPWTIGWGSTGTGIGPGTIWTQQQCDQRMESDVARLGQELDALLGSSATTQNQFDAMIDFAYNLGIESLASSTLLRLHKAGDYQGAAAEFGKWTHADGKVLPGLVKRRAAEAALYSS